MNNVKLLTCPSHLYRNQTYGIILSVVHQARKYSLTHKCYLSFTFCLSMDLLAMEDGLVWCSGVIKTHTHTNKQTNRNQFMESKQWLCFKVSSGKVWICCASWTCCASCSLVSIWLLLVSSVQGPRLHSRRAISPLESKSPEWAWDSPMTPDCDALLWVFVVSNGPFLALYSIPSNLT